MSGLLTVVIRTMPGREKFLDKCLFVLSNQTYPDIEVVVVAQQLGEHDCLDALHSMEARWASRFNGLKIETHISEDDARARSLNIGKKLATGRYLAFLDDDDKVYPEHYKKLINSLQKTNHAWAYTDIIRALYNENGQLISRSVPFKRDAYSFFDHLHENFIPIHSFVIDTSRAIGIGDFDEEMSRLEDYEYLLRLAFKYKPVYIQGISAEYCIRTDGSNSTCEGTGTLNQQKQKAQLWSTARDILAQKKLQNFGWWIREVDQMPLIYPSRHQRDESVLHHKHRVAGARQMLAEYYNSTSWKVTRPLRSFMNLIRRRPVENLRIPDNDYAAYLAIEQVLHSTSWKLSAPLRIIKRLTQK